MKELPKSYEAGLYEEKIYEIWEKSGFFNPDNLPDGKPFTMVLPPPNATGLLHLGHAVMTAIQDILARFNRLNGKKVLWLPGTDHAAIATQNVVEKKIWEETKKTRFDIGRDELIKQVNEFANNSRGTIQKQLRATGASLDWSRERYTLDEGVSTAVREMFIRMYNDGLIYRGSRIVNWCYRCGTTLADDEVEYKEKPGIFYYLKYGPIVIGTARPETKVLDKVIVVHPDDARYKKYIGQEFTVPWIDGDVKARVIADKVADMATGTGAMTITPAHSFEDFALAQKYNLEVVQIIGQDGKLTAAGGKFAGLNVKEARQAIVKELESKGLIEKIDDKYTHNLSVCYRCSTPVEPLTSKQWFVAVDKPFKVGLLKKTTLKKLALDAVRSGDIKIIPDRFNKTYFQWIENLHDWCISRQIWFGHRIPAWYDMSDPKNKDGILHYRAGPIYDLLKANDQMFTDWSIRELNAGRPIPMWGEFGEVRLMNFAMAKLIHDEKNIGWKELRFGAEPKTQNITNRTEIVSQENYPAESSFIQESDTLDTWFSSGMWTFATLGWPKLTNDLKTFHPTDVLETGYDILFFWIARMIMMTQYAVKQIPFRTVYLHGLVRDKQGNKMSKSRGNGIDPLDIIKKYGTDAMRLSMIVGTTAGNDFRLYEEKIAGYRNFVNKLWNISRYILMTVDETKLKSANPKPVTLADRWILSRLNEISKAVTDHINKFEFSPAAEKLYDFTWHELADWYLEIAKIEKNKDDILVYILKTILKLWHPFTPFVTEVLWGEAWPQEKILMVQSWPKINGPIDQKASADMKVIQDVITAIRNFRAENKIDKDKILDCYITDNFPHNNETLPLLINLRTKINLRQNFEASWKTIEIGKIKIYLNC